MFANFYKARVIYKIYNLFNRTEVGKTMAGKIIWHHFGSPRLQAYKNYFELILETVIATNNTAVRKNYVDIL